LTGEGTTCSRWRSRLSRRYSRLLGEVFLLHRSVAHVRSSVVLARVKQTPRLRCAMHPRRGAQRALVGVPPQRVFWRPQVVSRAEIVLATADGLRTNTIMRPTRKLKPCVALPGALHELRRRGTEAGQNAPVAQGAFDWKLAVAQEYDDREAGQRMVLE
jgi:hypothetical protein